MLKNLWKKGRLYYINKANDYQVKYDLETCIRILEYCTNELHLCRKCEAFTDYDMCDKEFKKQVILYLEEMRK